MTEREQAVVGAAEKLIEALSMLIPKEQYRGGYADDRSERIETVRAARNELRAALNNANPTGGES